MRRVAPVLVVALLSLSLATTPPAPAVDPVALEALLASVRGLSLQGRILGLSAQFLGTPYAHSPLGEGEGPDPDPRLRLDRMDCLTFVETVMALALSSSVEDVVHV
ncbi:MAG: N-acetylmuramoyl-L-alanine amidase-like domain-containing protein, partial [Myxococcaceae bacterium]